MIARFPHTTPRAVYRVPHCLIIEQDAQLLAVLIELFAGAGYEVGVALHGDDLQRIAAQSRPRLAIVSDGAQGTFDGGWRAARALKASDPSLPLLMLTSDRQALTELGATPRGRLFAAGVTKPFAVGELMSAAHRLDPA